MRTTTFQVTVYWSGSSSLTVSEVDIAFQWDPTTWRISSGSTVIPSGGSQAWSISEAIPALQPGFYTDTISVIAMTSGDVYAETSRWSGRIQIVANVPPVAAFSSSPTNADTNTIVQFTDQSTDADGQVVAWSWTFGDGATASVQNPTHQFLSASVYQVQLTVTDNDGATKSVTQNVQVVAAPLGGGPRIAGLGIVEWGILVIVIVAAAVIASMLVRRRRRRPFMPSPMQQPPKVPPPPP
jgi:PKD repeat protein